MYLLSEIRFSVTVSEATGLGLAAWVADGPMVLELLGLNGDSKSGHQWDKSQ